MQTPFLTTTHNTFDCVYITTELWHSKCSDPNVIKTLSFFLAVTVNVNWKSKCWNINLRESSTASASILITKCKKIFTFLQTTILYALITFQQTVILYALIKFQQTIVLFFYLYLNYMNCLYAHVLNHLNAYVCACEHACMFVRMCPSFF